MDKGTGDIYHVTQDDKYLRQAQAEAAYFDQPRFMSIDAESPVTDAYWNERFTGDKNVAWFETIPSYGTFRRGCALGAGGVKQRTRILQQNPLLHLTIYDISEESLAVLERELGTRFPGRVATQQADLNFAELPEDAYDLIISAGCVHHLLNLEHVAYQINQSLTSEGFFFLNDYVGEARFQFAEEKRRLFETAFEEAKARHPFLRSWHAAWPDPDNWTYSPFESVRSDETLDILRRYLSEVAVHAVGAMVGLLLFVRPLGVPAGRPSPPAGPRRRRVLASVAAKVRGLLSKSQASGLRDVFTKLGADLLPLDREVSDAGALQPANAFAVYRKRESIGPSAG